MEKIKYSIIIPTRNEEEGIAKVLVSIPEKIKKESEIIVADNSNDSTPKIAEALGARIIKLKREGKGYAMRIAAERAKGEILIFLDGDGTDNPKYIPILLRKLEKSNLVLGCRRSDKIDGIQLKVLHSFYSVLIKRIFLPIGINLTDPLAGFRAIRKSDWKKLNLKSNGFEIEAEMNIKAKELGFKIDEVLIKADKRSGGILKSKLLTNPKEWIAIMNVIIKYVKEKKLKDFYKKLKEEILESFKKLNV